MLPPIAIVLSVALAGVVDRGGESPSDAPVADLQLLAPGFRSRELPIEMTNVNGLTFGPDGRLYALRYDGQISVITDSDGDGLEDRVGSYWKGPGLVSPIAMAWGPDGRLYVSSHRKVSRLVDDDQDGVADREEVVASGWPTVPSGSNLVDAMGLAFGPDGALYVGIGCADFTNPYLIRDGASHYDPDAELGAILKIAPDFQSREVYASGLRFTYALAFNRTGDLFATDQEGETWLSGANPLDELDQIREGYHYGWPPRHPEYRPDGRDEPPVVGFGPQHQSSCGLAFNLAGQTGRTFGPVSWTGDAFVAGFSRGKLWRVALAKQPDGSYDGRTRLLASAGMMVSDVALGPNGSLYLALHSGEPDWGTGPGGEGSIVRIDFQNNEIPQPVIAWPSGPLGVRIGFDRAIPETSAAAMVGESIRFGSYVRAGDESERIRPPYKAVERQQAAPVGTLRIAEAHLEDEGRTLAIATDPHPWDATYALKIPGLEGQDARKTSAEIDYDLTGVDVAWEPSEAGVREAIEGWWPCLDPIAVRTFATGSVVQEQLLGRLAEPGTLTLRTLLELPAGGFQIKLQVNGPIRIESAELDYAPVDLTDARSLVLDGDALGPGQPSELVVGLTTGVKGEGAGEPGFHAFYRAGGDGDWRPIPASMTRVPWAPAPPPEPSEVLELPASLAGGDPARGREVFLGQVAKCATCHAIRGEGGQVGPDLGNLHERSAASIYRDVAEPSAVLNPDYIPYTVALKDGRVLTGVVRSDPGGMLRVLDTNAQETRVEVSEVEELRPSATSVMPVGLVGAIGEQGMRDLIAFLTAKPE